MTASVIKELEECGWVGGRERERERERERDGEREREKEKGEEGKLCKTSVS